VSVRPDEDPATRRCSDERTEASEPL